MLFSGHILLIKRPCRCDLDFLQRRRSRHSLATPESEPPRVRGHFDAAQLLGGLLVERRVVRLEIFVVRPKGTSGSLLVVITEPRVRIRVRWDPRRVASYGLGSRLEILDEFVVERIPDAASIPDNRTLGLSTFLLARRVDDHVFRRLIGQ